MPYKHDETIGRRAETVLEFADLLKKETRRPVETYDERLSTVEAEEKLRECEMSREDRRKKVNAVAAQTILQGYFNDCQGES